MNTITLKFFLRTLLYFDNQRFCMDNYFFNGYIVNQQARARRSGGHVWGLYYYLFLNPLLTLLKTKNYAPKAQETL